MPSEPGKPEVNCQYSRHTSNRPSRLARIEVCWKESRCDKDGNTDVRLRYDDAAPLDDIDEAHEYGRLSVTVPRIEPSMCHQDRNGHGRQDFLRHPAEDHLAHPRVSVGAHDYEIGSEVGRTGQHRFGRGEVDQRLRFGLGVQAMTDEMLHHVVGAPVLVGVRIDGQDGHPRRHGQKRQRVVQGAHGLPAAVPGNQNGDANPLKVTGAGHHQHGTAAGEDHILRGIQDHAQIGGVLPEHDEISGAGMAGDERRQRLLCPRRRTPLARQVLPLQRRPENPFRGGVPQAHTDHVRPVPARKIGGEVEAAIADRSRVDMDENVFDGHGPSLDLEMRPSAHRRSARRAEPRRGGHPASAADYGAVQPLRVDGLQQFRDCRRKTGRC
ncbi:protein of unknown function (plasmid) [Azospirillum baldaniorum]|uniref:Uncharacterized protein n=1 Tax=Azospirillum baldaniorum TaxID=1064539 RepID=A0A9P1JV51_9PROT|nr:protein of unknown function [Azospirillum baldaniorum]